MNAENRSVAILLFFCLTTITFCCCQENSLVVTTNSGKVLGKISKDRKGNDFYSFQSIPYAKPPLGDLRFKDPEPVVPWKNTLNATTSPPQCAQDMSQLLSGLTKNIVIIGQEDCLYLNIYTPMIPNGNSANNKTILPVMVNIHGGSFRIGSSVEYGPEFLLPEKIILVTINYRLGLLGFLNIVNQNLDVPGNAGLKDQTMALKWIKDNIQYFGGNPNNITIFGESAGSVSVHLHMLSQMSKGLFSKAIAQSGTGINSWVVTKNDNGRVLGKVLNISAPNDIALLAALRNASTKAIIEAQVKIIQSTGSNCCVVLEKQTNHSSVFLSKNPIDILKSGNFNQVPLMLGYNSQEGLLSQITAKLSGKNFTVIQNFEDHIPQDLRNTTANIKELAEEIRKFYYETLGTNSSLTLQPTVNFDTDTHFYYHIFQAALEHTKVSKEAVYFYRFSADTELNILKSLVPELSKYQGAAHADDVGYLFKMSYDPKPGSIEDISIDRVVRLWTNFAKYGNPTPIKDSILNNEIWKRLSTNDTYLLEIGNTIKASTNPDFDRYKFWKNIYEKYSF